jgi:hypothetical protein
MRSQKYRSDPGGPAGQNLLHAVWRRVGRMLLGSPFLSTVLWGSPPSGGEPFFFTPHSYPRAVAYSISFRTWAGTQRVSTPGS